MVVVCIYCIVYNEKSQNRYWSPFSSQFITKTPEHFSFSSSPTLYVVCSWYFFYFIVLGENSFTPTINHMLFYSKRNWNRFVYRRHRSSLFTLTTSYGNLFLCSFFCWSMHLSLNKKKSKYLRAPKDFIKVSASRTSKIFAETLSLVSFAQSIATPFYLYNCEYYFIGDKNCFSVSYLNSSNCSVRHLSGWRESIFRLGNFSFWIFVLYICIKSGE